MEDVTAGKEPTKIPIFFETTVPPENAGEEALAFLKTSFEYHGEIVIPGGLNSTLDHDAGCQCAALPCQDECECMSVYGYFYNGDRCMQLEALPEKLALYECSAVCACAGKCKNRVVQQGVNLPCSVRWIPGKGFGLFATCRMKKGSFLCLYAGEIISSSEAQRRWQRQAQTGKCNYILVIKEIMTQSGQQQLLRTTVDPTYKGNIGRFMNHACPPSATHLMLPIRPAGSIIPLPALFAVRDIEPGEELTWDYQDAGGESWFYGRESRAVEVVSEGKLQCKCLSPKCRGWIPYDPNL